MSEVGTTYQPVLFVDYNGGPPTVTLTGTTPPSPRPAARVP